MSTARSTNRWLFYAIVGVLLAASTCIIWSMSKLQERQMDLSEVAVDRTQQMLRVRLDGMFHELREDLREEGAALRMTDTTSVPHIMERWQPLLLTHWSITAVRVANELGSELGLLRVDSGMVLTIVPEGSGLRPAMAYRVEGSDTIPIDLNTVNMFVPHDPRTKAWFSRALESARHEPVWSIVQPEAGDRPYLQVAHLIRGNIPDAPYRILMFDVDIGLSAWVDVRSSPLHQFGALLVDPEGRKLNIPDRHKDPHILEAERTALAYWIEHKGSSTFTIDTDNGTFRAQFAPYVLNGQSLYAGTLMDMAVISLWTDAEWRGLIVAAVLLMLLILLLGWSWLRKRREAADTRRQEKYSRTQERLLAKALGEREVLNREVHHRVKNNLQVLSSLLNLQAMRLEDEDVRIEFLRGKRRIDIIALVHHKLYGLKDLRNVDLRLFFLALIEQLKTMYMPASSTVSFELDTGYLRADQDTAIELGVILCELVGNCCQHAFPYATGGHVDISVQAMQGDLYRLLVKDNGRGLVDGYADGPGKLGLEIVEALAEQLDGSFHTRTNGGTTFEVLFRMKLGPASAGG